MTSRLLLRLSWMWPLDATHVTSQTARASMTLATATHFHLGSSVFITPASIAINQNKLLVALFVKYKKPRSHRTEISSAQVSRAQTSSFRRHAMFWLMAPHFQRSQDAHLQVAFPLCHIWSWWCENGGRPSVRRQLISCPGPARVAALSQESSSEFWETHQHGNSCDSTWTWWKLFLFLLSLYFSLYLMSVCPTRTPGPWISIHLYSHRFGF